MVAGKTQRGRCQADALADERVEELRTLEMGNSAEKKTWDHRHLACAESAGETLDALQNLADNDSFWKLPDSWDFACAENAGEKFWAMTPRDYPCAGEKVLNRQHFGDDSASQRVQQPPFPDSQQAESSGTSQYHPQEIY